MRTIIKPKQLLLGMVLLLSVLPPLNLAGFETPVLYMLMPFGIVIFMLTMYEWIDTPKVTRYIVLFFALIILEIFVSTIYGSINTAGRLMFPNDVIQYVARFLYMLTFIAVAYQEKLDPDRFIKYFLIVLNITMLIGILQWIPWGGREFFIRLYPFRDGSLQLSQLDRPLHLLRLHGFSQHATANGGFASFAFIFAYAVKRYYKQYFILTHLLLGMAFINVIAGQARGGYIALAMAVPLFYIINIKVSGKWLRPTLKMVGILMVIGGVVSFLYVADNEFIVHIVNRWDALLESRGGGRVRQTQYFLSIMEGMPHYLLGLSRPGVIASAISYGVEIEPINIFITYGAIGFLLQYSLVLMLLVYFFKNITWKVQDKASLTLLAASFVGLFSYQVFSVAYFFFREGRVGLFPWILMGAGIGVYERWRVNNEED